MPCFWNVYPEWHRTKGINIDRISIPLYDIDFTFDIDLEFQVKFWHKQFAEMEGVPMICNNCREARKNDGTRCKWRQSLKWKTVPPMFDDMCSYKHLVTFFKHNTVCSVMDLHRPYILLTLISYICTLKTVPACGDQCVRHEAGR